MQCRRKTEAAGVRKRKRRKKKKKTREGKEDRRRKKVISHILVKTGRRLQQKVREPRPAAVTSRDFIKMRRRRELETIVTNKAAFRNINVLVSNIRGFTSKKETLTNIINDNACKIVILNETHLPENRAPQIKGFRSYSRARSHRRMGGVAVLLHNSIDDGAVKIETDEGDLEYVAVKIESFSPPLVVFSWYGVQESQFQQEVITRHISEVLSLAKQYSDEGCNLILGSNLNLKIGNKESGLTGNDEVVSRGGSYLLNTLGETDIEICNNMHTRGPGRTHKDATSGTERTLDLVLSNCRDKIVHFDIDEEGDYTPYRVRVKKNQLGERVTEKVFTDHRSIKLALKLKLKGDLKQVEKLVTWCYGKPGGRERYYMLTD